MIRITFFILFVCIFTSITIRRARAADAVKTQANVMTEITFTSQTQHKDPFNQLTLDVVFTQPDGVKRKVPGFWDGGLTWKVRYASGMVGVHSFRSECSDAADAGLNGVEGKVEVSPYTGDNPLYIHGPLHVEKGSRYLQHADGTPFFWLGDTWWMGLSKRLAWPEEFARLTADRKAKGFTVVQIVAGLYPDMPPFDERGANEAGFPWEKDYSRIRPEYFDAADKKIEYLAEQGIVPCVVGAWGYHLPWLGQEKMRQHERYLYARWGALPMVWCVAGELNLPYYLSPNFPNHGQAQTAEWEKVIEYCRSINAFDRPISAHPTGVGRLSMRDLLKDPQLLDFDMVQTPHGQMEVMGRTVEAVKFSYGCKPVMPVVNAEPSYEMLWDKTPPEVVRRVFWLCWAEGVKGYTYGANGIWQLNRRDKPYGNSPWGGGYGKIAWDDAMNLPGSTQVSLGKKLMMAYPWQKFEPHAEWAAWAGTSSKLPELKNWIWYPEGDPAVDAPIAARFFRRTFELPEGARVRHAQLIATADDKCTVWLNGAELGTHAEWKTLLHPGAVAKNLKPGKNVVAIRAENLASKVTKNPAGLVCALSIELEDGKTLTISTDAEWRAADAEAANWQQPGFDDAKWPAVKIIAPFGAGPWGKIEQGPTADQYDVPYAFGIPDGVRFVYVPEPRAIALRNLKPRTEYAGFYFDPSNGKRADVGRLAADAMGGITLAPPAGDHDWVLVLEDRK
ncbi:MAG TPA: DUF4038 domain-containing protein [Tepidisphaeraceae bacterium]|jgi:hypothetical protein|nr:DUF4038 domain-containing protein [Tepidisphaeraceae bacterium]